MHNKPENCKDQPVRDELAHPLKKLSEVEFAALGGNRMVFVRSISAKQLALFLPEAANMPEDVLFQMIMAADGAPMLIADNTGAVSDWLAENPVSLVQRH